ncbi:TonB family protein [Sandaracinobacter sp. RS1-74]|uniref:energy transducer TonB family protein n=1 Tax=Sandaracinobacteroides sayramensis TaxID=2913411 RepID=UPI001EDA591A|nr:energy transducer TonB [Sandaracinobacteroides sayramensis]MCG2841298.1 TonB family protein [Sandaracinobacteroides sayramensis]
MKPLVAHRPEREEPDMTVPPSQPEQKAQPVTERHGYQPDRGNRLVGLAGTAMIYALALAGFFFTINHVVPVKAPSALTVVNLLPEASPPETPPEEKEAPKPVEKKEKQPEPPQVQPIERTMVPIAPVSMPQSAVQSKPADPAPVEPETAAPKTAPAPPAPQMSSNAPDTWEGRVLAALNKHRRYPRLAMTRRQQGVPYIRFVMDREGMVLSSRLERSSGFPDLDREAVALPKRASPLPKPPADKTGDTLELVVPVEFFLK